MEAMNYILNKPQVTLMLGCSKDHRWNKSAITFSMRIPYEDHLENNKSPNNTDSWHCFIVVLYPAFTDEEATVFF